MIYNKVRKFYTWASKDVLCYCLNNLLLVDLSIGWVGFRDDYI